MDSLHGPPEWAAALIDPLTAAAAVIDALPGCAAVIDADGVIIAANERWRADTHEQDDRNLRYGVGQNYLDLCGHGENGEAVAQGLRAVLADAMPAFLHDFPCHAPNRRRWFSLRAQPLRRGDRVVGAVIAHIDITDLREQAESLDLVLEAAPSAILTISPDLRITSANAAADSLFGWSRAELIGAPIDLLIPEAARARHGGHATTFLANPANAKPRLMNNGVTQARRRDGAVIPVQITIVFHEHKATRQIIAVIDDLTEMDRINRDLRRANAEIRAQLENAEAMRASKDRFLSVLSHELRTPLNAINGFSELLRSHGERFGPDRRADYLDAIHSSGQALTKIADALIELLRIEQNRVDLRPEPRDLAADIRLFAAGLSAPGVIVSVEGEAALQARYDLGALNRVLSEVADNALRAVGGAGRVRLIVATCGRNRTAVVIEDDGIGIPAKDIPRLGEPLEQVGDPLRARWSGVGLGLAIAKRLVKLMGGALTITSVEGEGVRVEIALPSA